MSLLFNYLIMRKLNSYYYFFLIIIASFSFISCGDDTITGGGSVIDSSAFKYPLTTGNQWKYKHTFTVSDIRPDSIRYYFQTYPLNDSGTVTVSGDTIINGITCKIVIDDYNSGSGRVFRSYYTNTDTALLLVAYRIPNRGGYIFPKDRQGLSFKFNGISYRNLHELSQFLEYPGLSGNDSLIIQNPPSSNLKYPILTGKEWILRTLPFTTFTKKYTGWENIIVSGQSITCIKARLSWVSYPNITIDEYYSKFGKMRYDSFEDDILVSTPENPDGIGYVDIKDVFNVTSYTIITP